MSIDTAAKELRDAIEAVAHAVNEVSVEGTSPQGHIIVNAGDWEFVQERLAAWRVASEAALVAIAAR